MTLEILAMMKVTWPKSPQLEGTKWALWKLQNRDKSPSDHQNGWSRFRRNPMVKMVPQGFLGAP
jgi:hypothetical protein